MSKPILIAGATGTNGQALVEELTSRNVPVRALVRHAGSARPKLPRSVELVEGDLGNPESLIEAFQGVGKAYVVTAVQPGAVSMFQNFFAAAVQAGVEHLVKFSGLGASPDAPSEIIRQHATSDDLLRDSGIPFTILRPNSFHQNMLWQAQSIASADAFYLPLGDAAQSTIDVRDIATITANILTQEGHLGQTYDLTGPEGLTFYDVARILGEARGRPVTYVPVTSDAAQAAMTEQGMPEWHARALAELQSLFATGAYGEVNPDAERLLGRRPATFADFALEHIDAFKDLP